MPTKPTLAEDVERVLNVISHDLIEECGDNVSCVERLRLHAACERGARAALRRIVEYIPRYHPVACGDELRAALKEFDR
jgi:hypothetical protein